VEDIRLRFEDGRVVQAEASRGDAYLARLLELDAGARVLGEVAFGLNYEIDRFTRNILLDEKIGGTIHLALGAGFAQAGGKNSSALHWDMICDLREEGEVYADGELVWKAGAFLEEPRPVAAARGGG
jgi:aminopeptidase